MLLFFVPRRGLSIFQSTRPGLQASRSAIFCIGSFLMFYALGFVPVATATAVSFTAPLIVTALSPYFLKETVRRRNWAAVLLGFMGTLIIVRPGTGGMHPAALLILISALGSATTQVMSRKLALHDNPETSNLYMASVGFFLSSLLMPWVWTSPTSIVDAVLMSALGLFGGCGHYCLVRAFEIAPAPFVAPFNYAQIVGAAVLGFVCFHQVPDAGTLMGTCIIVISGLGALSTRQRSTAARAST
ncbi:DMT family transporter [Caballeronia glebae]